MDLRETHQTIGTQPIPAVEPATVVTCAGKRRSITGQLHLLIRYREMIYMWTARELRSRYRQSFLGVGWAIAHPVIQMVILSLVFGRLMKVSSDGFPYPIFNFTALLPWTLFSSSIGSAIPSVSGNIQLVSKIYFPREILPISAILARTVDFLIAGLVFVLLIFWYHVPVHATLLYLPLLLLIQSLLALGFILLGAAINVFVRDVSVALPVILQFWMYASPVIYSASLIPERWRTLYALNPMVGIIDSYRRVVLQGVAPDWRLLLIATGFSVVLCVFSYSYFKKLELAMSDVI